MADVAATTNVPAGSRVVLQLAGSLPVYVTDANYREDLGNQLRMQGLNVETIAIQSGYGLSSRDYTAQVTVTTLTPSKVSTVAAQVISAAENAGSYTPQVTVPSVGQASQPALSTGVLERTVGSIVEGVGTLAEGVSEVPGQLFTTSKLLIVGIVVLVALVALGPNLRGIGRNVSIGV